MNLDIRTLALMLAVISLAGACLLFFFYRILPREPGLKSAAIGAGCQAIACLLLITRDFIPPAISIIGNNLFFFMAYAFLYQTTRELVIKNNDWKTPVVLIVILMLPITALTADEHIGLRILINAIGVSALTMMSSLILFRHGPSHLPAHRGAALALLSICLICLYRIIKVISSPPGNVAFFDIVDEHFVFIGGIISVFIYVISVIVMTSERLRHEVTQQLNRAEQSRVIADKALVEQRNFITMLSHEFRTPLGIIKANTDVIRTIDQEPDEVTDSGLLRINNATDRLTSMVNGCLNEEWISNAIHNKKPERNTINIKETLEKLCTEYDVGFSCCCNPEQEATIQGDKNLIPILFSSLIDNARKYTHSLSGIRISCQIKADTLTVEVADNGPGIPAAEQARIFEKYYRIKNGNQRPGTGLGLYFAKQITEQHGGSIDVRNHNGTVFRVTLPLTMV